MLIDPANPGVDATVGRVIERDDQTFVVVASTPRSGTTYIRALLAETGIRCGHENVYKSSGGLCRPPDWLTVEVSGFAGLHSFTNDGAVLHQVRHPLNVISSLATLGIIRTHDPVAIAEWYCKMVANNEAAADFTYRVEDMDLVLLRRICGLVGHIVDDDILVAALKHVPRDANSRPRTDLTLTDLGAYGDAVAGLADGWGYDLGREASSGSQSPSLPEGHSSPA